ncbi:MAG: hypothetical protein ABSG67_14755 [Thermoguttaceae bacterium]|jgi:hypothetical protein
MTVLIWCILAITALIFRFIGSWLGRRIGARHVIAWFGALIGFSIALILLNILYEQHEFLFQIIRYRLFAGCMLYGSFWALIIEVVVTLLELIVREIKASKSPDLSNQPSQRLLTNRDLIITLIFISIVLCAFYFSWEPVIRFRHTYDKIGTAVENLANRRPKGVTVKQWETAISWTHNDIGNCLCQPDYIKDMKRFYNFADQLDEKIKDEVDLSTIDWIWDEISVISTIGQLYSDKYRPTTPERLKEAEESPY